MASPPTQIQRGQQQQQQATAGAPSPCGEPRPPLPLVQPETCPAAVTRAECPPQQAYPSPRPHDLARGESTAAAGGRHRSAPQRWWTSRQADEPAHARRNTTSRTSARAARSHALTGPQRASTGADAAASADMTAPGASTRADGALLAASACGRGDGNKQHGRRQSHATHGHSGGPHHFRCQLLRVALARRLRRCV